MKSRFIRNTLTSAALVTVSTGIFAAVAQSAQQPANPPSRPVFQMPPPTPNDTLKSVEVQPDRHVRFRIWAPSATTVKLQAEGPKATPGATRIRSIKT